MVPKPRTVAAVLLYLSSVALAHGGDERTEDDMDGMKMGAEQQSKPAVEKDWYYMDSYSSLSSHSRTMVAHVAFMIPAWFFILPICRLHHLPR